MNRAILSTRTTLQPAASGRLAAAPPNTRAASASYWPGLLVLFLGTFIAVFHTVSLNVALHGFLDIFDTELATAQWLMTGFTLATGIIAPLCGSLGDKYSNKRLFLLSVTGLAVSSLLCAVAWNIYALIVFRMVQGLFCGLIQPVALAMIYQIVPTEKRSMAIGLWSTSTVLGPALAPTICGWLQAYNWHLMFLVTLPICAVTYVWARLELPDYRMDAGRKLDGWGVVLAVAGSLALLTAFGNSARWGWTSWWSIGLLAAGLLLAGGFVWHQLRTPTPLLKLRLFASRMFTASILASIVLIVGLFSGIYFVPLYLQEIHGMTSFEVAILFIGPALVLAGASFLSGILYDKIGPMPLVGGGALLLVVASYAFSKLSADTSIVYVGVWMAVRYAAIGLSMTPAMNAGMSAVDRSSAGDASALINWMRQLFGALGLGLFTALFYSRMAERADEAHADAYSHSIDDVFWTATLVALLAVPISLWLRNRGRRQGQ